MRIFKGATMRAAVILFTALLVSIAAIDSTCGQAPNRAARGRGGRFGAKPGEIITPPDRSERWANQLRVGGIAPEFTLPLAGGTDEAVALAERSKRNARRKGESANGAQKQPAVFLKELRAKKPVVLIFGSVTCPPFRSQLDGIDDVYLDFRDRAEFVFVYIREAHPDSVLSLVDENRSTSLMKVPQPDTLDERSQIAATCGRTLELSMPIAVDSIDNRVGRAYAGWPNRMLVVGTDGRILFATDPAPRATDAFRLRAWLEVNLPTASH
ncbi:MAG: hypothetical protein L0228_15035 [Planctomycetes bacterium]|nr:hypothetical protein [Planctomycetota bacterium]